jgi:hypothetical protein
MATVAASTPTRKPVAFYAHLFGQSGMLGKVDGTIYFFGDNGDIMEYEPDMANFCTVLGETDIADTQKIMDRIHGGYAAIACHRNN